MQNPPLLSLRGRRWRIYRSIYEHIRIHTKKRPQNPQMSGFRAKYRHSPYRKQRFHSRHPIDYGIFFGWGIGIFPSATALSRLAAMRLVAHVGENSPPDCFLPQGFALLPPCSNPYSHQEKKNDHRMMVVFLCIKATKKIFLPFLNKVLNSNGGGLGIAFGDVARSIHFYMLNDRHYL